MTLDDCQKFQKHSRIQRVKKSCDFDTWSATNTNTNSESACEDDFSEVFDDSRPNSPILPKNKVSRQLKIVF